MDSMIRNVKLGFRINDFDRKQYVKVLDLIKENDLTTVCIEANCPNRYECFSKKTVTFMILGDVCTRNCQYCNIKKGVPQRVDENEPEKIALAIKKLSLSYAVITCVTRDDLEDGGANQFVETVLKIREINPKCKVELLISDLGRNWDALKKIVECRPDVINHNIEVVKDFFNELRPNGNYEMSLELLRNVKEFDSDIKTKSGLMIGFGENMEQISNTISDLKKNGCDILTIGQYLQPSQDHFKVKKIYSKKEFDKISEIAKETGFEKIACGSLVRSSYQAGDLL